MGCADVRYMYPKAEPGAYMAYQGHTVELASYPFWAEWTEEDSAGPTTRSALKVLVMTTPGDDLTVISVLMGELTEIEVQPADANTFLRGVIWLVLVLLGMGLFAYWAGNHGG